MECHSESAPPACGQPRCVEQLGCAYRFHPVRRRGATEQCLWLGPRGYSGRGRGRPDTDTYSYRDGDRASKSEPYAIWYDSTYTYCHADCNSRFTHTTATSNTQTSAESTPAAVKFG